MPNKTKSESSFPGRFALIAIIGGLLLSFAGAATNAAPFLSTFSIADMFGPGIFGDSSSALPNAPFVSPDLVISQVYGGGGNSGATFEHDFIEIFNRGNVAVSLDGKSVQYGSATGNFTDVTALGSFMLQPGQYYLVRGATGRTTGTPCPLLRRTSLLLQLLI